jgi:hypothetical protein
LGWVTKEQIERARQVDVLDYVLTHERYNVRRVRSGYRAKDHKSLAISENGFYWHSKNLGGKTALDYLTDVRGYRFVDAVCLLLGESPQERSGKTRNGNADSNVEEIAKPPERKPFALPIRNKDNNRVIAYLQSRGIDKDSIMNCIERGVLYESKYYHNAVFLGKDENGKTRYAAMRSITTSFMRDSDGSDKRYGFVIPPTDFNTNEIAAFEAPIDCLSHQSLCKLGYVPPFDGWRLSLGGTSDIALKHFIVQNPAITHCLICTDCDKAGDEIAEKIMRIPDIITVRIAPIAGKDWNDALLQIKETERKQNKAQLSVKPSQPERG